MDTLEQRYLLECALLAALLAELTGDTEKSMRLFRDCMVQKFPHLVKK